MLFFVRFDVTQPANVSNKDLVETWIREAEAAIGAMDAGAVPHLWKVAGQRLVSGSSTCRPRRTSTGRSAACRSSARWAPA